ncbi:MAG TPA: plastocyanin/azurin family copper-binding protein [Patescibacteria group bacterium]|nr:plastocyanin/azurin family copper-binding protein [Patescibacteria group bacterium]
MRRIFALVAALATLVLLSNVVVAADRSVRTIGDERVVLNSMVQATLRFTPGMIKVASGGTVTWTHDDNTTAPHTVTIVANPPGASLDEIFACAECAAALAAHSAGGFNPVVNVGGPGLDAAGDSLFIFDDQTVSATVTAPSGTTLKYLCAIHPWMQGTIVVN